MSLNTAEEEPEKLVFLLDVIVTRLSLYKDRIDDPNDITVTVNFNKIPVKITSSRINVTEFQNGRRTEFEADPATLRQNIENDGMSVIVRYTGLNLGHAKIAFPQCFIDRIQKGMTDLLHSATCDIKRRDLEVGTVELLFVLIVKCEEITLDKQPCDTVGIENLGKAINTPDIMFVVGEQTVCPPACEPCLDELEPEEGDERLKLDIARYPSLNQRVTEAPRETAGVDVCGGVKAMTTHYSNIIDSVVKKLDHLTSPLNDDAVFTDWNSNRPTYTNKAIDYNIPVPLGDTEEMGIKPIRFCPVCLTPMSWLPKYAPCPKCCTKAQPPIEELDEIPTADQIINEVLKLPSGTVEDFCIDPCAENKQNEQIEQKEQKVQKERKKQIEPKDPCATANRCSCKNGKLCTHCRIRNLCENMFNPEYVFKGICPKVEPKAHEDFCVVIEQDNMAPNACRPYLERVFAELQDLYTKRESTKAGALSKRCAQSLLKFEPAEEDRPKELAPKLYTARTDVNRPPLIPKFGHKTCVKREGNVSRRHGWDWASTKKARKYGWRPGAICRYAGVVMRYFLQCSPENNAFNTCRRVEEEEDAKELPILNVCKKNGSIYITLRPSKNPHVHMKPIVFKVVKSDLAVAMREIKKKLKDKGFRKCTCHQTLMMCVCREVAEKKQLEAALQKECKRRRMENCGDHLVLTDTSNSEMEYDFDVTPPRRVGIPQLAIKPRTINITTQTEQKDRVARPTYPRKVGTYWRAYDCAAGDRYMSTAFGAPGESVFEDGLFGYRGGGPHGKSAAPGGRGKAKTIWGASHGGPMRGGSSGKAGGAGRGGGPGRGGGVGGIGGGTGGKAFPGALKKPTGPSPIIPVRMPRRHVEAVKKAAQDAKDAVANEIENRKKGINLMKYLMKKGAIPTPWNPNEPKKEVKTKTGPVLGPDGLTDAQRKRRALNQICMPPFESLARLGKGYDPCIQCNSCCPQWYNFGGCGCYN